MHRILERLDAAAGTLVPLLYLFGLMLGAVSYFAGITLNLGLAVGIALASAAELHSFLQQRRVRADYTRLARLSDTDDEYEQAKRQFKINTWILVGLLAFSAFNATTFVYETWTPAPGPLAWRWAQIIVRGVVVALLFFAAGFLAPLHTDAAEQLQVTSAAMLHRTLKAIDRQWRGRLKRAEKRNADLAPVAIALLQEQGDHKAAKRLALIAQGLHTAESGAPLAALAAANEQLSSGLQGIHALPTQHLTPPTPQTQAAPPAPLSRHDQRRAALAESMYTDLDEYDLSNADDAPDAPADDFGEWGDDGDDSFARRSHPTRPRGVSLSNQVATRSRAQAAHIAPRGAELVIADPDWVDPLDTLPASKYEQPNDSDQCRRVMRVLDQDNTASRAEVMQRAHVGDGTARKYIDRWNTLRTRAGSKKVGRRTQEVAAISRDMLSGAASK